MSARTSGVLFGTKGLVAAAIALAGIGSGRVALAHDTGKEHEHGEHAEGAREHGEHGEHEEAEEHDWHVFAEMVLGFGKGPLAVQLPPTPQSIVPGYGVDSAKVVSESFLLGAAAKVGRNVALGIRVPFTFGSFSSIAPNNDRGTTALGNIELEAEYERHLGHHATYFGVLGISLPTAQGDVIPEDADLRAQPNSAVDQNAFDRFALNRTAALTRGSEENALFEPKRLGINPKIAFDFHLGGLHVAPYLKLENLIATGNLPHKCGANGTDGCTYLGEFIPALALSYRAGVVEPMFRVWANIAYAGVPNGEESTSAAIEPRLGFHFGGFHPSVGAILPIAGPAKLGGDTPFAGVRFHVAGTF